MPLQRGPRPMAGRSLPKSIVKPSTLRPVTALPRPGSSPRSAENRAIRREAIRQIANQIQPDRPRPVVKPITPAVHVMVPKPAPVAAIKPLNKPVPTSDVAQATAASILALNTAQAHTDLSAEMQTLQSSLSDLLQRSSFSEIHSDVTRISNDLQRESDLLESAREKGYAFQSGLESEIYEMMSQWDVIRPDVSQVAEQQATLRQAQLLTLNPLIQGLNRVVANPSSAAGQLRNTQSYVNDQLARVASIESDLQARYAQIDIKSQKLNSRLSAIHWAMDQLAQAKFQFQSGENLVMAVPARWDKEGKDDPEGVLYLSNHRLIFERKEKVATKKVLFITTASELAQEVLLDFPLAKLKETKAESRGLFGHQDFLQLFVDAAGSDVVSLHLSGQDSKEWAILIERCKSGQIESERAHVGTALSVTDITRTLTPADLLSLQSEVNTLQDEIMLKGSRQELARLENDMRMLERKLAEVRAHGYSVEKDLEADITILSAQWDRVKSSTQTTIDYQSKILGEQMVSIQSDLARLMGLSSNLVAARPVYLQVKSALASIQAQADAAIDTVVTQFDDYADEVESLDAHLEWVRWMLGALATASFQLLATEGGVAAVEAMLIFPGSEPENGVLFLTDQRLLWEDRTGGYELKLNVPLSEIAEAIPETENDILCLRLSAKAALPEARLKLSLPVVRDWIQMVNRARSGGYNQDRAVEISAEELGRIRNAPQSCQNCGAAFTTPILRGQSDLTCEYCGKVTRI